MSSDCYCQGTRILTVKGDVPIESLTVGDIVVTASGKRRAIKWIGHRDLDLERQSKPIAFWPVRVQAGAFREGSPSRDLWLSPGHCVFVDNVLVPVRVLVNRASIAQVPVPQVSYWHVELDGHDVLVAEGLPAESYLDVGNRSVFDDGTPIDGLDPLYDPGVAAATCAPVVKAGPAYDAIKSRLLERATELGYKVTAANDLHVVADGARVDPIDLGGKRLAFVLPPDRIRIQLVSRTFVPWQMVEKSTDGRVLGVCVKRLQIDGKDLDLKENLPADAWHGFETRPSHVQRWTKGVIGIPRHTRIVIVELGGDGRYWDGAAAASVAPTPQVIVRKPSDLRRAVPRREPAPRP